MKIYVVGLAALIATSATSAQQSTPISEGENAKAKIRADVDITMPHTGTELIATDRAWRATLEAFARSNGLVILRGPTDSQIAALQSATVSAGAELDGECTEYQIGFVIDSSGQQVWPVVLDIEGRKMDLLRGRDGVIYIGGPAGVEPLAKPRHGRRKTDRRHRRECRRVPRI